MLQRVNGPEKKAEAPDEGSTAAGEGAKTQRRGGIGKEQTNFDFRQSFFGIYCCCCRQYVSYQTRPEIYRS
nr:hypothetical protein BaRGS_029733 [Batillaria attramentaria]